MTSHVRLKGLAICLAILSLAAVLLEAGPVAAGGSNDPGSAASRTVMWIRITDLLSMSQSQLAQWKDEGIGGFAAGVEWLPGMGGNQEFTGDPNTDLSSSQFTLENQLKSSNIVSEAHALGMKLYLGLDFVNYYNTATPLADWFDDSAWANTVLPSVAGLAGAAHLLGFDGISMDGELYAQQGNVQTATWAWNYPGNTHTEQETRDEATLRGQQLMEAILQAFPEVQIADFAASFPDTWDSNVFDQNHGTEDAYQSNLDINFWDGMTSVDGYAGIWFYDETFYKDTGLSSGNAQTWNSALTYEYNSLFSLFSQDFSNWSYAADHVYLSPSAWIDGTGAAGSWTAPRPPAYVATQLQAFRNWGMGGEIADFAYAPLNVFDYSPYVSAMQASAAPGTVDSTPPMLAILNEQTTGNVVSLSGTASDDYAIRDVSFTSTSGVSGAASTSWQIDSGSYSNGYVSHTNWNIPNIRLLPGDNRITITAEDIHGLTRSDTIDVSGGSSNGTGGSNGTGSSNGANSGGGYWLVSSDGGVFSFGDARFWGSTGGTHLNAPIVDMAPTFDGNGYWLVGSDGGIFNYGDASFYGSTGSIRLNKPIVGMAASPDGKGYWLVASDGGIFNYGDASFYGSTGSIRLNKPIVGMAATPDGKGYWLVASDGGIFNFGDAGFFGSAGSIHLSKPVVGMAAAPDGLGYWLVASDGGIFNYGIGAGFYGSTGSIHLNKPIVGIAASLDGGGYSLVASDGGTFDYGDAGFYGSTGGQPLNAPIVGLAWRSSSTS